MADTTPRLNPTPADPRSEYSPISWMAATALFVAGGFAVLLFSLVLTAFTSNKPLIEFWLFAFPLLGIVLAFAGRRHIVNSEGTRTGLKLSSWAWWICLVTGLGYAAYIGATEYTIRSDTDRQFTAWSDNLKKIEPGTPNDPALANAFYQTLPPSQRIAFSATNTTEMQARFGPDFATFRQNKLLMMILRNPGQSELLPQGLKHWEQSPGRIECVMAALLKTPEGEFPMVIPMEATVEKGKREWQIKGFDNFVQDSPGTKRTPYGWLVEWLDYTGKMTADQFVKAAAASKFVQGDANYITDGILAQPVAFEMYHTGSIPKNPLNPIVSTAVDRVVVTGVLGLFWPTSPAYVKAMQGDFFLQTPMADGKMVPEANAKEDFLYCWKNIAFDKITASGKTLPNSPDKNTMIRFFPDRVEIAIPIELKIQKTEPKNSAALGRLVLTLDDPKLLAELKEARELGLNGLRSENLPVELQTKPSAWKVARIESNLKIIKVAAPGGPVPPGGGGPGGEPDH